MCDIERAGFRTCPFVVLKGAARLRTMQVRANGGASDRAAKAPGASVDANRELQNQRMAGK